MITSSHTYYSSKDTNGVLSFVSGAIERASILLSGNSWQKEVSDRLNAIEDKRTRGLIAKTITNVDRDGNLTLAKLTPARQKVLGRIVANNEHKERNLANKVHNIHIACALFASKEK